MPCHAYAELNIYSLDAFAPAAQSTLALLLSEQCALNSRKFENNAILEWQMFIGKPSNSNSNLARHTTHKKEACMHCA